VSIDANSVYVVDQDGNIVDNTNNDIYCVTAPNADDSGLYIDFNYDNIKSYTSLVVVYSAILNENAGIASANVNTADLIYSNSPFVGTTYDPEGDEDRPDEDTPGYGVETDTASVYTYAVAIHKTDSETGEPLEGATFELYSDPNCSDYSQCGTATTDKNGYAYFVGIAGPYWLKEVSAPAGYTLSDDVTEVRAYYSSSTSYYSVKTTVSYSSKPDPALSAYQAKDSKGNLLYLVENSDRNTTNVTTTDTGIPAYTRNFQNVVKPSSSGAAFLTIEVTNTAGKSLPGTGGIGVVPFIAVGSVLMIGAVVVLVTRKRMRDVEQG
jgi:LPXTG-motif cell wall-anchored protein